MNRHLLLLIFVCCFSWQLLAQDDELIISPDRPGMTYSATTAPKGFVMIETGLGLDLTDSLDTWSLPTTDLRYGLLKNFELRAGLRGNMLRTWGISDLSFEGTLVAGFKWLAIDKKVQLTYLAEVMVPLYPNIVNAYHMVQLSHPIGDVVGVGYMLLHNYNFAQLGTPNYGGDLLFALNINFQLTSKWSFYIGGTGTWDSADPTTYQVLYDAGVAYLLKKNLQLDIFFGHGINYKHGTYGIGVSWMPTKERKFPTTPSAE